MPSYLCLSVTFLDPSFHGRGVGGEPEWAPSPLRRVQALVASSAARWSERQQLDYARPALKWLEEQPPPDIVAPPGRAVTGYQLSVPNNAMDLVGRAWSKGNYFGTGDSSPATHRAMKAVRPTHLHGGDAVHYLWTFPDPAAVETHTRVLEAAARSIVALGWGVDLVAGYGRILTEDQLEAEAKVGRITGERWRPTTDPSAGGLRVPTLGTLSALVRRHGEFLDRLNTNEFPPLSAFAVVGYRRATDPADRLDWAPFRIISADADAPRNPAFDTAPRCCHVAAWVRHATGLICDGWPFGDTVGFVQGHDTDGSPLRGEGADDRFMYLPLPTIERRGDRGQHVGSIRRVLIAAPPRFADRVEWVRRRLPGQELTDEDRGPVGLLNTLPASDWVLRQYTNTGRVWSTVTPVILPGHDEADPKTVARRARMAADEAARRRVHEQAAERVIALLRRAIAQAGFPPELARAARLEWRTVGFRSGLQLARLYRVSSRHERFPRYHVRITWPAPVQGPVCLGVGRYYGMGVFATEESP